jgi:hypothetical protein
MTENNAAQPGENLLDYAMAIAHERELDATGHKHDSDGAVRRFKAAVECALLSKLRAEGVQAAEPVADSMIARVDAAMVEMKNIHPPLRRSECERLIRAALASAPVPPDEITAALDWLDDFVARCNGDDRGVCESVNLLRRALASAPVAGEAKPVAWRAVWTGPTPGSTAWRDAHEVAPPDAAELSARGYSLEIAHAAPQPSEVVRILFPVNGTWDAPLPTPDATVAGVPYWDAGHMRLHARTAVLADRQQRAALSPTQPTEQGERGWTITSIPSSTGLAARCCPWRLSARMGRRCISSTRTTQRSSSGCARTSYRSCAPSRSP